MKDTYECNYIVVAITKLCHSLFRIVYSQITLVFSISYPNETCYSALNNSTHWTASTL